MASRPNALEMDRRARAAARLALTPITRRKLSDLAKELAGTVGEEVSPRMFGHLLERARERELVRVQIVDQYPADIQLDERRSAELAALMPGIEASVAHTPRQQRSTIDLDSQHALVGAAAASLVGRSLGRGERVYVSAGRAAAGFVNALSVRYGPRLAQARKLYALTGSGGHAAGRVPGVSLDADSVVLAAARRLDEQGLALTMRRVLLPAAVFDPTECDRLIGDFAPFLDGWHPESAAPRTPEWVIAGLGHVTEEHALATGLNPYLEEDGRLRTVLSVSASEGLLVGEIAHHLFLATPDGTAPDPAEVPSRLTKAIDDVNAITIGPRVRDLNSAKRLIVLAAGSAKAPLLMAVALGRTVFDVTHVVADELVADAACWSGDLDSATLE